MAKKKTAPRTKSQKAARRKADARKNAKTTPAAKPKEERPDVEVTVYPRAGDNPDFEGVLDQAGTDGGSAGTGKGTGKGSAADKPQILGIDDVAEWVGWPFALWAQSQDLPGLSIDKAEAKSIAEPLASILNRHGVSEIIPPDVVDGLRIGARATPVIAERLTRIKQERERRAGQGRPVNQARPAGTGGRRPVQGSGHTKPVEV